MTILRPTLLVTLLGIASLAVQVTTAQAFRDITRTVDATVGRVVVPYDDGRFSFGSGFIIGPSDRPGGYYFVTNHHVIEGAPDIGVGFLVEDNVVIYPAQVVRDSPGRDLALLKLAPPDGQQIDVTAGLAVATREIEKGENVAAIGFPGAANVAFGSSFDANSYESTLTTGTVSRVVMGSFFVPNVRLEIIQHTAEINQGNSGGPLIDPCGVVVGVNTAGALAVQADGIVPQGVYLSSSGPEIADFLRLTGVDFTESARPCTVGAAGAGGWEPLAGLDDGTRRLLILGALLLVTGLGGGLAYAYSGAGPIGKLPLPQIKPARRSAVSGKSAVLKVEIGGKKTGLTTADLQRGVVIGRGSSSQIRLDVSELSRAHARLYLDGRRLMLTDLGSSNGTTLDGKALSPNAAVQINTGSRILLADRPLQLRKA